MTCKNGPTINFIFSKWYFCSLSFFLSNMSDTMLPNTTFGLDGTKNSSNWKIMKCPHQNSWPVFSTQPFCKPVFMNDELRERIKVLFIHKCFHLWKRYQGVVSVARVIHSIIYTSVCERLFSNTSARLIRQRTSVDFVEPWYLPIVDSETVYNDDHLDKSFLYLFKNLLGVETNINI